ncbi:MAG: hypothetical protein IJY93_04180 [Clostridia bacterium]|nr:hypothetical protein [Clostridia bacterium]
MPSMLMLADTQFPRFTETEGSDEKFDKVYNYLYMLLEQLRYTLSNLGSENFNTSDLGEIGEVITAPLSDELQVFRRALVGEDGDMSQISQTGSSLISRIASAEGSISTLMQTSVSLTSRIEDAEGAITEIKQTGYSISLSVDDEDTPSYIQLLSGKTVVSSLSIEMLGVVTFSDLAGDGTTTINGANITTGTISAVGISACDIVGGTIVGGEILSSDIYGSNITLYHASEDYGSSSIDFYNKTTKIGSLNMYTEGTQGSTVGITLESDTALKLYSFGNMSIQSENGTVYLYNVQITEWNGTGAWTFRSDGIYHGSTKVVSV